MIPEDLPDMDDAGALPENVERLLRHLETGSLAARLVLAYSTGVPLGGSGPMADVLNERLEQVREALRAE